MDSGLRRFSAKGNLLECCNKLLIFVQNYASTAQMQQGGPHVQGLAHLGHFTELL